MAQQSKGPRGAGIQNQKPRSRIKFGMTKRTEPARHVLNLELIKISLFQHLVCSFVPLVDVDFVPIRRAGFSDALLIKK
jgi:hypothetical protein